MPMRPHERETTVLLCVAFAVFMLKFWGLGTIPFFSDEPRVQSMIDADLRHSELPATGLLSTRNVHYGPTSQWAFLPVRAVTAGVVPLAAENVLLFGVALLLLFMAVRACMGENAAAWTVALAASSPYLFYYLRVLWETTFIIVTSAMLLHAVAMLHTQHRKAWWAWAWLGLSAGLALNTHLLMVPFIGAAVLLCLWSAWRHRELRPLPVALGALALLCVSLPYLLQAIPELLRSTAVHRGSLMASAPRDMLVTLAKYLSFEGMEYFFDWPKSQLALLWNGKPWAFLFALRLQVVLMAAAAVAGLWYAWRLCRRRPVPAPVTLGIAGFAVTAAYFAVVRPVLSHPHYVQVIWWLPFVLAASVTGMLRGRWRTAYIAVAGWSIALNILFVASAQAFIERNAGTRGPHYGATATDLYDVAHGICAEAKRRGASSVYVDIGMVRGVHLDSLKYLSRHVPGCTARFIFSIKSKAGLTATLSYPPDSKLDAHLLVAFR